MLFEVWDCFVEELCQRVEELLFTIDFDGECLDSVEECVQVKLAGVVLALHILEADVKISLEKLIRLRKARHSGEPRELEL